MDDHTLKKALSEEDYQYFKRIAMTHDSETEYTGEQQERLSRILGEVGEYMKAEMIKNYKRRKMNLIIACSFLVFLAIAAIISSLNLIFPSLHLETLSKIGMIATNLGAIGLLIHTKEFVLRNDWKFSSLSVKLLWGAALLLNMVFAAFNIVPLLK